MEQALILISKKQAKAIGEIAESLPEKTIAMTIVETNLGDTIAVSTNRGTSLLARNGDVHKLEGRGA
jgi:hypothetical protein